ncbi:hypothetical protein ACQPYK_50350 (plasmid) [Streptosporangium sp. CA-135522]|uniref:hypothetical protein n=1 Tax=Streptosporangium sp. CA-135522 TaxID=3240072 RepID=UPI003D9342D6
MPDQVDRQVRTVPCPTCQAGPDRATNTLVVSSDEVGIIETWHTPDCADHLEWERQVQISVEEVRREQEWAEVTFPAASARLQEALRALPVEQRATPFVAALAEVVELQAIKQAGRGGFVGLEEWAQILERHFPPAQP